MAALVTNIPRQTGVPNPTTDAINAAIDEINLAGGDLMGDRSPGLETKHGTQSITAAKLTESVTAGFTVVGVIYNSEADPDLAGSMFVATTSAATAITVTFTRNTSAAADVISYILLGA